jgi:hypothetical protein
MDLEEVEMDPTYEIFADRAGRAGGWRVASRSKMSVHTASALKISCRFVPDTPKVKYPVDLVVCETPAQLSPTSHDDLGLKNDDTSR